MRTGHLSLLLLGLLASTASAQISTLSNPSTASVTSLTQLPTINSNTILGNSSGSPATPSALTVLPTATMPALTGDVTNSAGSLATTIANGSVSTAKMANIAANSVMGNNTGSPAAPIILTTTQTKSLLAIANTDVSGLGTASTANTGSSGHTVPFLDQANTFTGLQTVTGDVKASGGLRAVGALTAPAGFAMDLYTDTVNGLIRAFNSTSTTYGNLILSAAAINFTPSGGSTVFSVGPSSVTVTGTEVVGAATVFNSSGVLQAAAFPALTGDVTTSAGALATTIANGAVTLAKQASFAASSLMGNPTGAGAAPSAITLAGGLGFSGTTLTAAGALTPTSVASTGAVSGTSIAGTTTILSSGATSGIGYATGAGGTITQITSRATGVTLNKACGAITLVSAAGSATWSSFTVTDSAVAATDVIIANQKSGTDIYMLTIHTISAGSFVLSSATTGGTTTETPVIQFCVVKGVNA